MTSPVLTISHTPFRRGKTYKITPPSSISTARDLPNSIKIAILELITRLSFSIAGRKGA